jgi:hypothetical protein
MQRRPLIGTTSFERRTVAQKEFDEFCGLCTVQRQPAMSIRLGDIGAALK